ncbi:uncharacterized protein N7529_007368 [Penicillium soppii]|uniref:uncharacterized protein n=1 Tax=Penicillium soppii TaxID=69789 RepID=UPI0025487761|nr:uncharacterized protein N7529_007368 [Penicillium soppii]KAJ5860058.1 hypothetical protein N7529_007368 [Penicillium soppii]
MSTILLQTLVDHDIQDRIFGLTADNTSNNRTLVDSLQQALPPDVNIIRTPCLAYMIQLSLKQLLDCLKAAPLNDTTETKWTEMAKSLKQSQFEMKSLNILTVDERSEDVESDSISDTKEQAIADSKDLIDVITDDDVDDDVDNDVDDDVDGNHVSANTHTVELPLPEFGPRIRTSGRKRKITLDDEFETY